MSRIDNVADYVIKVLKKHGVIVHRYDSYSTNSVYLKLDYGLSNSIRISDHTGKKHLSYKYNIITGGNNKWKKDGSFWRYYCNIARNEFVDRLLEIIINDRQSNIIFWGPEAYKERIEERSREVCNEIGFWEQCFEV